MSQSPKDGVWGGCEEVGGAAIEEAADSADQYQQLQTLTPGVSLLLAPGCGQPCSPVAMCVTEVVMILSCAGALATFSCNEAERCRRAAGRPPSCHKFFPGVNVSENAS